MHTDNVTDIKRKGNHVSFLGEEVLMMMLMILDDVWMIDGDDDEMTV